MGRIVFYLVLLLILAALAGAIYTIVVDLPPPRQPVEIDLPARPLN